MLPPHVVTQLLPCSPQHHHGHTYHHSHTYHHGHTYHRGHTYHHSHTYHHGQFKPTTTATPTTVERRWKSLRALVQGISEGCNLQTFSCLVLDLFVEKVNRDGTSMTASCCAITICTLMLATVYNVLLLDIMPSLWWAQLAFQYQPLCFWHCNLPVNTSNPHSWHMAEMWTVIP